jgi:hypothetical protein
MKPLARHEIIDQLERLGIDSPEECRAYINDYVNYYRYCSDSLHTRISRTVRKFFQHLLLFIAM